MNTTMKAGLGAIAAMALLPATALAKPAVGDKVGSSIQEIVNKLKADGHTIREIEHDDNEFEVETVVGGVRYELEISSKTGKITDVDVDD